MDDDLIRGGEDMERQKRSADEIVASMTLHEKALLCTGADFWHTRGVERLGIPSFRMTDGPHGITVSHDESGPATCFPTGVSLGASFNRGLLERIGAALGREAWGKNSQVILGPAVDIHRSPLNGRNYESYSEDPYLSGELAAAYIRGAESVGTGCAVKHFTCNNQQTAQQQTDVRIDERALREIYLPAFRSAVSAGVLSVMNAYNLVNGSHCSENRHLLTDILKDEWGFEGFIVSDWRSVHTTNAILAGLDLEMPGPGNVLTADTVERMARSGTLDIRRLDDAAGRVVRAALRIEEMRPIRIRANSGKTDSGLYRELAFEAACEGAVLLRNEDSILPFDERSLTSLAVIGPNAFDARLGGGGSSSVTPFYSVGPLEGIRIRCGETIEVRFAEGCSLAGGLPAIPAECLRTPDGGSPGLSAEYFASPDPSGEPVLERTDGQVDFSWGWASPGGGVPKSGYSARWDGAIVVPRAGRYSIGLSVTGGGYRLYIDKQLLVDRWIDAAKVAFEDRYAAASDSVDIDLFPGTPRAITIEFAKTGNTAAVRLEWRAPGGDPIEEAAITAGECDRAVVFLGLSNRYEGGNNDRRDLALPAEQIRLVQAVAEANPKTVVVLVNGSPVSFDSWAATVPGILEMWYPGQEGGNAVAALLFGDVSPSGRLPETFPARLEDNPSYGNYPGENGIVRYEEGIFVGYRHYDTRGIKPRFRFGFGLSYTSFRYDEFRVVSPADSIGGELDGESDTGPVLEVSVVVRNTGRRRGGEVVQLFVADPECTVPRPVRELRAFDKVMLEAGESVEVRFGLRRDAFCYYEPRLSKWIMEPGDYIVEVGGTPDRLLQQTVFYNGVRFSIRGNNDPETL